MSGGEKGLDEIWLITWVCRLGEGEGGGHGDHLLATAAASQQDVDARGLITWPCPTQSSTPSMASPSKAPFSLIPPGPLPVPSPF